MRNRLRRLLVVGMVMAMIIPAAASASDSDSVEHWNRQSQVAEITLVHTNDFHGRLETDYKGRGGSANVAGVVDAIEDEVGRRNVVMLDAGDAYFAAPAISQLLMGESTIDIYNRMGYDLAIFGNHEFDKGQEELAERVEQSDFPWLGANVVLEGTEWDLPDWAEPYTILNVGSGLNKIKLGVLGLAGQETPDVTLIGTTAGLEFKDLTETVLHYQGEIMDQADALVVVVHMGSEDSGAYKGLATVAQELIDAGSPVDLMIGGHQHQALFDPIYVGDTAIVSAGYYGRWVGQIDLKIDKRTQELTVNDYQLHTVLDPSVTLASLATAVDDFYADGSITKDYIYKYLAKRIEYAIGAFEDGKINKVDKYLRGFIWAVRIFDGRYIDGEAADTLLAQARTIKDNLPDTKIASRVAYWAEVVAPIVNEPVAETNISLTRDYNDESIVGDIVTDSMLWSADLYDDGELNGSVDAAFTNPGGLRADIVIPDGASLPHTVTWGDTFEVLPFGNTLYLMDLTGAQIQDLLDQSALLYKGILQASGASYHWYNDAGDDTATAWGAYGVEIGGEPLVRDQVYTIVTNDFLAGGQDGWTTFADGVARWNTYYDMQEGFVEYVKMLGVIDAEDIVGERIVRLDEVVTMLHTNDSHGDWPADSYYGDPQGFEYLASLVADERAHNPNALLLDAGDTFQGNSFAYFFKDDADNPIAGGMNLLDYDAMVLGNHEFNFGPSSLASMLGQVEFPLLGTANLDDDGSYGFINDNVDDYINLDVNGKKVTIFGITNPRVYRYELPTNIPGLTFFPAVDTAEVLVPDLLASENPDLLVGLTHVGYQPYGDEIDSDELIAQNVAGIDVIVGGHSHSRLNPAVIVSDPTNNPDGTLVAHAQKYALWLGQVNVGWIGDEIVLREGYLIPAAEAALDPDMSSFLSPYVTAIDEYNGTVIGNTLVPIDGSEAYTEETNSANLQADSAVWEIADKGGPAVDIHLSGAMTSASVDAGTLTKGDMFNLMKYENSLVVLSMNGPEIKRVLERAYRNYWYFEYDPDYGGYSHYTTCNLATDFGNTITYLDEGASVPPTGDNVVSLLIDGVPVDFTDDVAHYNVSTVNYVAAGSCNFNDAGVTIWPLDEIIADTQLYVRDSVINYVEAQPGDISPAVEGRLVFTTP
ncbi:MAG: hypothetical protein GY788_27655 [bacterium]|nr:hypothetical protein [bacterium]